MKINNRYFISMDRKTKSIKTNLINGSVAVFGGSDSSASSTYYGLSKILQVCRKRSYGLDYKNKLLTKWLKVTVPDLKDEEIAARLFKLTETVSDSSETITSATDVIREKEYKNMAKDIADKVIRFFSEFNFTPSFRFINTLAKVEDKSAYTINYFNLQNHSFAKEISDKVKSAEFKDICAKLSQLSSMAKLPTAINSRFELYFGEPGTGKTTKAIEMSDTCIVCSSDMLPTDLMQNFAFSDGKAEFQKSDLWKAMEEGRTIILDEINMLPFESLRFLQGILDNKNSVDFKGFHIDIHENFKVIGTMNLNVNGQCIPLPAPLVDRCSDIKEYKMNASLLANALIA